MKEMVSPFCGLEDRLDGAGGAPASRGTTWPTAQLAGGEGGEGCTMTAGVAFEPVWLSDEGAGGGGAPAPMEASWPAEWLAGGVEGGG